MLETSLRNDNNLLIDKKDPEEQEIVTFEDEEPQKQPVQPKKEPLEQIIPQAPDEDDEPKFERPEDEIGMAYDFTIPKQHLLDKKQFPIHKRMIEPISQDIATAHLNSDATAIVHDNYRLILMILALGNMTGKNMIEAQRFHVGKISTYANVSKGELGNLLKILRSNYTITEQKSEEKIQTDQKMLLWNSKIVCHSNFVFWSLELWFVVFIWCLWNYLF